jgi:chloramphenicol 3-O phosphotransferase
MMKGKVILLNGVSGAGKTTLARALQDQLSEPYIYLAFDDYHTQMPKWVSEDSEAAMNWVDGFHRSILAFASAGNNVIADHLFLARSWFDECLRLISKHKVLSVAVWCDIKELEERGSRHGKASLARRQVKELQRYLNADYDLVINTSNPVDECIKQIKALIEDKALDWSAVFTRQIKGTDVQSLVMKSDQD